MLASCQDLGPEQRAAYSQLLTACSCLQRKQFTPQQLDDTRAEVVLALAMVEAYLPTNELDIKLHMLLHLVDNIANTGPAWVTSMFVYESMWAQLLRMATRQGRARADDAAGLPRPGPGVQPYCRSFCLAWGSNMKRLNRSSSTLSAAERCCPGGSNAVPRPGGGKSTLNLPVVPNLPCAPQERAVHSE